MVVRRSSAADGVRRALLTALAMVAVTFSLAPALPALAIPPGTIFLSGPAALAVDQSTGRVLVAETSANRVAVVDSGSGSVLGTVSLPSQPRDVAVDSGRGVG